MSILFDLSIILLFFYFAVKGYKKGFMVSFVSLLYVLICFAISIFLSNLISNFVYLNFIEPFMISKIEKSIVNGNKSIDGILSFLPSFILDIINNQKILVNDINHVIYNDDNKIAELIVEMLSPTVLYFVKHIVIIILFFLLIIMMKIFKNRIIRIFKIPVLGQMDSLIGMFLGIVKCFVIIMLLSVLLNAVVPLFCMRQSGQLIDTINNTNILKFFYNKCTLNVVFGKP